jgi:hypothetical protein
MSMWWRNIKLLGDSVQGREWDVECVRHLTQSRKSKSASTQMDTMCESRKEARYTSCLHVPDVIG